MQFQLISKVWVEGEQQVYIQNHLVYEEGCGLLPSTATPKE
jgi:hypothetical protein